MRVFDLKGEFAVRVRFVVGAIKRKSANVDRLARLIDRLLGSEKDGRLVAKLDGLRVLGRANRSIRHVVHLVPAGQAGGETKLRLKCAATVEPA